MDDLLNEFLTETAESLSLIDVELVQLEQNPSDSGILSNIFRLMHTIKGTCGFLGLPRLESVAHAGENVLGKFRDGELEVTAEAVTAILKCIDVIRGMLADLEENGAEAEGDDSALIAELNAFAEGRVAPAAPASVAEPAERRDAGGPIVGEGGFPVAAELLDEVDRAEAEGIQAASVADIKAEMRREREAETAAKAAEAKSAPTAGAIGKGGEKAGGGAGGDSGVASQSIRVPVETLEALMTLVSELVLTRNQLLQMVRGQDDSEFTVPLQRLSHITSDLQEGVMKTRMQPIGNAWAKLPRIVRDLALETNKKLELKMFGAETELDRQVLELIKDPLTHMVRNSADHGIERPRDRLDAGKPETGIISLNAYHEGGHIIIKISDDGRGLDTDRIREKALERQLVSEAELDAMSDQQVNQFIFKAGFSTAEKVTSVSGRGVGMDVVRTNIEKIGGTIELVSSQGRGSTFTIKIPLTLAIVSALIVSCEDQRFAIPQISVLELVRAAGNSENRIELINDAPLLRLRDRLLPLVDLKSLFKLNGRKLKDFADDPQGSETGAGGAGGKGDTVVSLAKARQLAQAREDLFVVVTQVGNYSFGIIVDEVFDTEEIVVKPVAPILRGIPYYAGNTILGDGGVIMILDPNGIAGVATHTTAQPADRASKAQAMHDRVSMLVFRGGTKELKAVPLELVARLEEIDVDQIERSQGRFMIQYRGHLMPLVLCDPDQQWRSEGHQPILVFTDREHAMGLAVGEIVDIVEDHLDVELSAERDGILGSAIINGKATSVIDTGYYLTQAFADWFGRHDGLTFGDDESETRLLLVEDSAFFRNMLSPLLEAQGYHVTGVATPLEALELRDQGVTFDIIISDIEMPGMNGFDFARAVRDDRRWASVPMVALSSYASERDLQRGRAVGFTDYVAKFDREGLLQSLANCMSELRQAS